MAKRRFPRPSNNEPMRRRALSAAIRDSDGAPIFRLNRVVLDGSLSRKWRIQRLKEKGLIR